MTKKELRQIKNRIEFNKIVSNLVYPMSCGYHLICQLDHDWVTHQLRIINPNVMEIGNKYACVIPTYNRRRNDLLIYNHDGKYFLINK